MSVVLKGTIQNINTAFATLGIKREYSYADMSQGVDLKVMEGGAITIVGGGYQTLSDAVADLCLDAFEAMAKQAGRFKAEATNPLPALAVYETIRDLVDVAVDGVEARERDADGLTDRINVQAGQYAVERGRVIIDQYSDAYRGGDLK